jgi:hypothetical protein
MTGRKHSERFHEPQRSQHLGVVEQLKRLAAGWAPHQRRVVIAWAVRNHEVDGATIGHRTGQVASIL